MFNVHNIDTFGQKFKNKVDFLSFNIILGGQRIFAIKYLSLQ